MRAHPEIPSKPYTPCRSEVLLTSSVICGVTDMLLSEIFAGHKFRESLAS